MHCRSATPPISGHLNTLSTETKRAVRSHRLSGARGPQRHNDLRLLQPTDGVGFEPTRHVNAHTLSKRAPSATRPPVQSLPVYRRQNKAEGVGFEPTRLFRVNALAGRRLQPLGHPSITRFYHSLARQDSNLESSGPEPDVLPIPPRANAVFARICAVTPQRTALRNALDTRLNGLSSIVASLRLFKLQDTKSTVEARYEDGDRSISQAIPISIRSPLKSRRYCAY